MALVFFSPTFLLTVGNFRVMVVFSDNVHTKFHQNWATV